MSKISVQQRKYFTERIQNAINNKISVLKHKNASRVTKMGNKQFDNYLNEIEIKDQLDRFKKVQEEYNELSQNISLIYSNIKKALYISNYESFINILLERKPSFILFTAMPSFNSNYDNRNFFVIKQLNLYPSINYLYQFNINEFKKLFSE